MATGKLSSSEINGLLDRPEADTEFGSLSKIEMEALMELWGVSLRSSSSIMSELLSEQVTVTAPTFSVKKRDQLFLDTEAPFFVLLGEYTGGVQGIQLLSINKADVQSITKMAEPDSKEEDMEKQFEVLQETVQQMFASVSQSLSALLELEAAHSLSGMDLIEQRADFPVANFTEEEWFAEGAFLLKMAGGKEIPVHLCISVRLAKGMVGILTDSMYEEEPEETKEMQFDSTKQSNSLNKTMKKNSGPSIQPVQFSSFDETAFAHAEPNNLDMLMDIPLQVTVELGRTKRTVKEVLSVSQGSIIELDKLAGEPVDILVNDKLIAVGEVVVIDENFGVRVTDILSTAERISKLR